MSEEVQSVLEALEIAMNTEKRGREFYQKVARETDYLEARQMFLSLAEDEMEHLNWLKAQRDSLLSRGEWLPYQAPPAHIQKEGPPIFSDQQVKENVGKYRSEIPVLRLGLEMEESSRAFYEKAAGKTDDEEGKAMFYHLAAWERGHWEILKREYDLLMEEYRRHMGFEPF